MGNEDYYLFYRQEHLLLYWISIERNVVGFSVRATVWGPIVASLVLSPRIRGFVSGRLRISWAGEQLHFAQTWETLDLTD